MDENSRSSGAAEVRGAMRPATAAMIEWLMRARGITQRELARAIGMPESELSTMMRGRRGLGLHWLEAIAAMLGVSPGELLDAGRSFEDLIEDRAALMDWLDRETAKFMDRVKATVLGVLTAEAAEREFGSL